MILFMFRGGGWWTLLNSDDQRGKVRFDRNLFRRIFKYARPYWRYVGVILLSIILTSSMELIPPLLYRDLIDNVIPNKDFTRLTWLAIGMIGIPLLSGLIGTAERYFSARAGEGIIYDLRSEMYAHLQSMSLRFFTLTKSGEIISRFNNDVVGAQNAIVGTIPNIVTNLITLVSTLVIMLSIEWRLALLSVAVFPLFLLPARRVATVLRDIWRKAMEHNADMSSLISETLSINGALLVKTFSRQKSEVGRFRDVAGKVRDIGVRRAIIGRWFFLGLGLASAIGTALIYWAGGYLVLEGALTVGTIVAFAAYLARLYGPISSLSNVQVEFATSMVSFERVFEYLDLPVEIRDREDARELLDVAGRVEFDRVSFSYLTSETTPDQGGNGKSAPDGQANAAGGSDIAASRRWALKDLSFKIEPGELVALVGQSGAGKTTVTYLLPRLYDPTEGGISLDGYDLRDVTQESLARQIGVVTQETYLFHDTVRANLLYAKSGATQEEIEQASRAAHIHEFLAGLPEGYDTIVGERGYRLSGGEKQRLAIARVILKDPRVLILDEATSHLDSHNEALIQDALAPLFANRTSLVIAHRLSTILAADKILVLDEGTLAEQGSHAELLAKGGLYSRLYETQFRRGQEAEHEIREMNERARKA